MTHNDRSSNKRRKSSRIEAKKPTKNGSHSISNNCGTGGDPAGGATGSRFMEFVAAEKNRAKEQPVSPIILKKDTANSDLCIFNRDINMRLNNKNAKYSFQKQHFEKEDVLQKREYDYTNKVLPDSQPLSPLAGTITTEVKSSVDKTDSIFNEVLSATTTTPLDKDVKHNAPTTSAPQVTEQQNDLQQKKSDSIEIDFASSLGSDELPSLAAGFTPHSTAANSTPSPTEDRRTSTSNVSEGSSTDTLPIQLFPEGNSATLFADLPPFTRINLVPERSYNNIPPNIFSTQVHQVYEEMVTWKKNLFLLPTGNAGKCFVKLISEWVGNFNSSNTFQGIAMKVVAILPNLLLQKPSAKSKAKEHTKILEQRLEMWNNGNILGLLRDSRAIQKKLKSGKIKTNLGNTNPMRRNIKKTETMTQTGQYIST